MPAGYDADSSTIRFVLFSRNRQLLVLELYSAEHGLSPVQFFTVLQRRRLQRLQQIFQRPEVFVEPVLLGQITDDQVAAPVDDATVLVLQAADDFQQSRFAGTVRADQPDPISLADNEIQAGEQALRPI